VPGGQRGLLACAGICTLFVALGTGVGLFPGTLESIFGLSCDFNATWGVSRATFELFTRGTPALVVVFALVGYADLWAARIDESRRFSDPSTSPALPESRSSHNGPTRDLILHSRLSPNATASRPETTLRSGSSSNLPPPHQPHTTEGG
jgi:hypothetical protein